jgi:hypothetical protein
MTTYYTDAVNGNNGNSGLLPNDAWATLDYAIIHTGVVDTINLRTGTYKGQFLPHATIQSYNNEKAIIDGNVISQESNIEFKGLEIWNSEFTDRTTQIGIIPCSKTAAFNTVTDCIVHDCDMGFYASRNGGQGTIFDGCIVYHCGEIDVDRGHGTITVDMRAISHTVSTPYYWTAPATTFPEFGAFVLEKTLSVAGDTTWGHQTGVLETNVLTFAGNWTGTGGIIGSGDAEKIGLHAGEYMISEVVDTGIRTVKLLQNSYDVTGDNVNLDYRHGATQVDCEAASWNDYTVPFVSLGFVQIRLTSTL